MISSMPVLLWLSMTATELLRLSFAGALMTNSRAALTPRHRSPTQSRYKNAVMTIRWHSDVSTILFDKNPSATSHDAEGSNVACNEEPSTPRSVSESPLTHADLTWKIRLPPDASLADQAKWSLQTKAAVMDYKLKGESSLPRVWIPDNVDQIVLEAWNKDNNQKIARFGIRTRPGPAAPPIIETVQDVYGDDFCRTCGCACAAIIYMFVEPDFRSRQVGPLALQVISFIQAVHGADLTVLVADDKGSGKLVQWYQRHGFHLAPKLQDLFGSPNQIYGTTMIGRAKDELTDDCTIEWW